jgi:hypothetical protein
MTVLTILDSDAAAEQGTTGGLLHVIIEDTEGTVSRGYDLDTRYTTLIAALVISGDTDAQRIISVLDQHNL